jgi:hypothetical protein
VAIAGASLNWLKDSLEILPNANRSGKNKFYCLKLKITKNLNSIK